MITEETFIINCNISLRVEKIIIMCKIYQVKDLLNYSIYDLAKFRGIGKKSLYELIEFVAKNGFKLKKPEL